MHKIKDIVQFQNGYAFKSKDFVSNGQIKIIKIKELKDGLIKFFDDTATVDLNIGDYIKYIIEKDDILIALTGDPVNKPNPKSWVGRASIYRYDEISLLNQRVCKVIPNRKLIDRYYLYYYLIQYENFYNLASKATGSASQANISTKTIGDMEIDLPDMEIQKKIGQILFDINRKIEVNNKLNENLRQLLQSIYNISFSKLERLGKVYDLGYIQGGYAFKSKSLIDDKTDYKIIKIRNISGKSVDMINTQYISKEVFESTNKKFILDDGDVVIAMTGAELGKTGIINNDDWITLLNQRVGVVRSESSINKHYLSVLFLSKAFQQKLNDMGYGSAQPNISSSDIENIEIIIPEDNLLNEFYQQTKDIYQKQIEIEKENRKLYLLRDNLLPKLMSGEIDLDNFDLNI